MGKETTDLFFNSGNIFIGGLFLIHDFASIRFGEPGMSEKKDKDGGKWNEKNVLPCRRELWGEFKQDI